MTTHQHISLRIQEALEIRIGPVLKIHCREMPILSSLNRDVVLRMASLRAHGKLASGILRLEATRSIFRTPGLRSLAGIRKPTLSAERSRAPQASWLSTQLGCVVSQNRLQHLILSKNSTGVHWRHRKGTSFPIGNKPRA